MAEPPEEDLKARAALDLKRVMEISSTATKTAIFSFSALAVIWFGQIRPQYELLLEIYPELPSSYSEVRKLGSDGLNIDSLEGAKPAAKTLSATTIQDSPQADVEGAASEPKNVAEEDEKSQVSKRAKDEFDQLASLVNTVSFDVFGLKLSVPPLWASVIWNILLLGLLLYLAQARSTIWRLCADALTTLKQLGKTSDDLDEIAGSGPVWIAPPPSRSGKTQIATIQDLRSAFGWNRLETLPSLAATTGFLLLGLLQLNVAAEGFAVIKSARNFTSQIEPLEISNYQFKSFERKVARAESKYDSIATENNPITVKQKLKQLRVSQEEASLLSLLLSLMLLGMLFLTVCWFRPWSVPSRLASTRNNPQRLASTVLILVILAVLFLLIQSERPTWGSTMADKLADLLPGLIRFVSASVVTFCLIELSILAFAPSRAQIALANDGKST